MGSEMCIRDRLDPSLPSSAFPVFMTFDDGSIANRIILSSTVQAAGATAAGTFRIDVASVVEANASLIPYVAKKNMRTAFSYATNNVRGCTNGGAITSDNLVNLPVGITGLGIGKSTVNATQNSRWIASLRYYNAALTDAQLQAMTA